MWDVDAVDAVIIVIQITFSVLNATITFPGMSGAATRMVRTPPD